MDTIPYDQIKHIEMRSKLLAEDVFAGHWHSAFKGAGIEFEEVRPYQIEDDIRAIDWKVTARSGKPYVKLFKEERELTAHLVVDCSNSMQFGKKQEYVGNIGGLLAFSAMKNNDKMGLTLFTENIELHLAPKKGRRHLLQIIRELLSHSPKTGKTDLKQACIHMGRVQKKRSLLFLLSDFLTPIPKKELSILSKHHDVIAIQVLSPYEHYLPEIGILNIIDSETLKEKNIKTEAFAKKNEDLRKTFIHMGIDFIECIVGENYEQPLKQFFEKRRKRF